MYIEFTFDLLVITLQSKFTHIRLFSQSFGWKLASLKSACCVRPRSYQTVIVYPLSLVFIGFSKYSIEICKEGIGWRGRLELVFGGLEGWRGGGWAKPWNRRSEARWACGPRETKTRLCQLWNWPRYLWARASMYAVPCLPVRSSAVLLVHHTHSNIKTLFKFYKLYGYTNTQRLFLMNVIHVRIILWGAINVTKDTILY